MKKNIIAGAALAILSICGACTKTETVTVIRPNPLNKEAKISLPKTEFTVDANAQNVEIPYEATHSLLSAESTREWCKVEIVDGKLKLSVDKNEYAVRRGASVTLVAGYEDNVTAPVYVSIIQGKGQKSLPAVGDLYGKGVVYQVDTALYRAGFYVFSLSRLYGIAAQWSVELVSYGLNDKSDGMNNVAKVKDFSQLPAMKYCHDMAENMGQGWYLPAQDEFHGIMVMYNGGEPKKALPTAAEQQNRNAFEAMLSRYGGDVFNSKPHSDTGESYWMSCESDWETAFYTRVGKWAVAAGSKTSQARGARCIQHFDLR